MKINFTRVLLFLIAIFVLSIFLFSLNKINIYDTKNLIGQNIKSFEIKSFKDEKIISEKNLKENKYTLINFWASWCAPCRAEHKYLIKLKNNTQNLKILGVNFKDKNKDAKKFIAEFGDPYHISGKDPDGRSSVNFGIYGIPESILVDQSLIIVRKFIGPLNFENYKEILNLTK
tara:strand:+ start:1905 stop:2426 length:522 start_codon:yes stop_codon:yes gene_type:complete